MAIKNLRATPHGDHVLTIACPYCTGTHDVLLDASGHYDGPLPCAQSDQRVHVQVDPFEWRVTMDLEHETRVQ